MKKIIFTVSLFLVWALALPALACQWNDDGKRHCVVKINGVLGGTLEFVPFPDAATPYDVDSLGLASGFVKGLGHTNMFTFHRPVPDGSGDVMDGLVKIVTPRRGIIEGTYVGTTAPGEEPDQLIGTVEFEVTGGTGRFENASGIIYATAYITFLGFDVFEWPVTWVLEGEIEY